MGQARRGNPILAKEGRLRLKVYAKSYRIQVSGPRTNNTGRWNKDFHWWYNIQAIPRTHTREDVELERATALSAFKRRLRELDDLFTKYGSLWLGLACKDGVLRTSGDPILSHAKWRALIIQTENVDRPWRATLNRYGSKLNSARCGLVNPKR